MLMHAVALFCVITVINCAFIDQVKRENSITLFNQTKEEAGHALIEARKKEEKNDMMSKILPLMVIPFMVSTAMIPMMLVSLKFMLMKKIGRVEKVVFIRTISN
nr:PREDICTED: uncharacterized protein LOC103315174 isoform X2 [Tribolium castaneum]|eukprot:XP_015839921.1 PREDICTED: uncharacterized protein LOC103315174 isoform X2 [Tribolium castaneum]